MNKKRYKLGFTLGELFLVIVILSLLVIGVVPAGLSIYNKSRKKTLEVTVEGLFDAAKAGYNFSSLDKIVIDTKYEISNGVISQDGNIDVEYSGGKIKDGIMVIRSDGETAISIHDGKYCATKKFFSSDVIVYEKTKQECVDEEQFLFVTPAACFTFSAGKITNYNHLLAECTSDVVIPSKINGTTVIEIDGSAFNNKGLTSVHIPNTVIVIDTYAFSNNLLKRVVIPNSVTTIFAYAFMNNFIENVTLSKNLTEIGYAIFANNLLRTVELPSNITSISGEAFVNNLLTSVTIPPTVTLIDYKAFANNQLTSIALPNSVTTLGYEVFKDNHILQGNATIDNYSGAVTIGYSVFDNNGPDGLSTITPVYLRH